MTETKAEDPIFAKFAKVDLADVIDCPRCKFERGASQPISPAVGYCRWCKLSLEDAKAL